MQKNKIVERMGDRMDSKVSVIMPSLNVAPYIEKCIDSVLNQTLKELEIICVDAGSTDGTIEILKEYAKNDSRVVLFQSEIKSYGKQVNMGFDYASGEYVAILETDDWIELDMYETLYKYAKDNDLDYAAADFDKIYKLNNGAFFNLRTYLFYDNKDWYGKILNNEQLNTLRASDYVLWKGIYNRSFLNKYRIRLHESPKAAFQDMGFLQQVKTYVSRAMYLDKSFYRYRQDRDEASSNNINGLIFYKNEFEWINEKLRLIDILSDKHIRYYYFTMSISLMSKYDEILKKMNWNWRIEQLQTPYQWFKNKLKEVLDSKILTKDMYAADQWEELILLMLSPQEHSEWLKAKDMREKNLHKKIIKKIEKRPVVIFGCGIRGNRFMMFCNRYNIPIRAFCDNNKQLCGSKHYGYDIISVEQLAEITKKENLVIVISVLKGKETIYEQIKELKINADIIEEIPN